MLIFFMFLMKNNNDNNWDIIFSCRIEKCVWFFKDYKNVKCLLCV